jgi:hypothetical protein
MTDANRLTELESTLTQWYGSAEVARAVLRGQLGSVERSMRRIQAVRGDGVDIDRVHRRYDCIGEAREVTGADPMAAKSTGRPAAGKPGGKLNAADRKGLGSFPRSVGGAPKTRPRPASVPSYPPGHFTLLIKRHDWPPAFEPQFEPEARRSDERQVIATREQQTANAVGWGSGTLPMTKTPRHARPAMAKGRAA